MGHYKLFDFEAFWCVWDTAVFAGKIEKKRDKLKNDKKQVTSFFVGIVKVIKI